MTAGKGRWPPDVQADALTLFGPAPEQRRRPGTTNYGRLTKLASNADRSHDPCERAKLLVDLRAVIDGRLEDAVAEARAAGTSWRQLAARLGVPYQTLHRRYRC